MLLQFSRQSSDVDVNTLRFQLFKQVVIPPIFMILKEQPPLSPCFC